MGSNFTLEFPLFYYSNKKKTKNPIKIYYFIGRNVIPTANFAATSNQEMPSKPYSDMAKQPPHNLPLVGRNRQHMALIEA